MSSFNSLTKITEKAGQLPGKADFHLSEWSNPLVLFFIFYFNFFIKEIATIKPAGLVFLKSNFCCTYCLFYLGKLGREITPQLLSPSSMILREF